MTGLNGSIPVQVFGMVGGQVHSPSAGACSQTKLSSSASCPQTPSELLCSQCGHSTGVLQLCLFSGEPVAQKAGEKNPKSGLMV